MNNLKWVGTFFVLTGILLTNINIYPLNIFYTWFWGCFMDSIWFLGKDKAIMTNFGFQIPIFAFGITNYYF